jgi:hypothetical protein
VSQIFKKQRKKCLQKIQKQGNKKKRQKIKYEKVAGEAGGDDTGSFLCPR